MWCKRLARKFLDELDDDQVVKCVSSAFKVSYCSHQCQAVNNVLLMMDAKIALSFVFPFILQVFKC